MPLKSEKIIYLGLTIFIGILAYIPTYNIVPLLTPGDLGREFYAFEQILKGQVPYRDFYWQYGPVMPYYYALFYKTFGIVMPSLIIGRIVLNILSGAIIYACLILFTRPIYATLGAIWFWCFNPDFVHTFNHTGGVTLILLIVYCLLRQVRNPHERNEPVIAAGIFLLLLVKLNMGLIAMVGAGLSYWMIDRLSARQLFPQCLLTMGKFIIIPFVLAAFVYILMVLGVPDYFILQCFPYLPSYDQFHASLSDVTHVLLQEIMINLKMQPPSAQLASVSTFSNVWPLRLLWVLGISSLAHLIFSWFTKEKNIPQRHQSLVLLGILTIFAFLLSHEFLRSATTYRLWWCTPIILTTVFLFMGSMFDKMRPALRIVLFTVLILSVTMEIQGRYLFKNSIASTSQQFLDLDKAQVYVKNSPEWIDTVTTVTKRMQTIMSEEDLFLALPYEPLYYYLTNRTSPVPELIIVDFLNVTGPQQERVIRDLERKKVNWILISNRSHSPEKDIGYFGITHSVLLADYINKTFDPIEIFGDWDVPGGWIFNHAQKIYRRKATL